MQPAFFVSALQIDAPTTPLVSWCGIAHHSISCLRTICTIKHFIRRCPQNKSKIQYCRSCFVSSQGWHCCSRQCNRYWLSRRFERSHAQSTSASDQPTSLMVRSVSGRTYGASYIYTMVSGFDSHPALSSCSLIIIDLLVSRIAARGRQQKYD